MTVLGYTVETVDSGEAALNYLKKRSVDLIVLDMIMAPGMNGRETHEQIIELYPQQKAIIASGYADSQEVRKTLALGASLLIQKPYNIATIAKAVHSALLKNPENSKFTDVVCTPGTWTFCGAGRYCALQKNILKKILTLQIKFAISTSSELN